MIMLLIIVDVCPAIFISAAQSFPVFAVIDTLLVLTENLITLISQDEMVRELAGDGPILPQFHGMGKRINAFITTFVVPREKDIAVKVGRFEQDIKLTSQGLMDQHGLVPLPQYGKVFLQDGFHRLLLSRAIDGNNRKYMTPARAVHPTLFSYCSTRSILLLLVAEIFQDLVWNKLWRISRIVRSPGTLYCSVEGVCLTWSTEAEIQATLCILLCVLLSIVIADFYLNNVHIQRWVSRKQKVSISTG